MKEINQVSKHEDFDLNYRIQMAEIELREKELWENNRFCDCGAESIEKCSCEADKQRRFRKRRKRIINDEFEEELSRLMKGQLPKDGSQSKEQGEALE